MEETIGLDEILNSLVGTDPVMYQYFKCLKERKILINDEVNQNFVESVMIPLLEMDSDGTGEPIEIILCTPGGSTFTGMPLCNIIDNLKTPTTITVLTYTYSMGGVILCAGYDNPNVKKRCYKFSTALLHAGSTLLSGNAGDVKDTFKFQDHYEQLIKDYIISHSKITEEEYDIMERKQWYMTSAVMLEKGLVDEII